MSDSLELYRTIVGIVLGSHVHFHDIRCLVTFAWAIVGILLEKSVHLSKWGIQRSGETQAASKQRQFARWLKNNRIVPNEIYKPLAQTALLDLRGQKLYLALDGSSLWDEFVIVRLALVYRGRALPISWVVLQQKSTTVAFEKYKHILKEAATILPKGCSVILLADRGFDDNALFCAVRDLGWGFRIRLKKSILVQRLNKPSTNVGRLMPAKGGALFLHKVWITERWFGPVYLALAHAQTPNGYEEWAILSDDPTDLHTFDEYGLRFDIEEDFLDDKSAGFQLESGEIRNAEALSRLGLILAAATLYLVSTRTAVVTLGLRTLVDTHWQRGLSYFQIGWRWIHYALAHSNGLLRFFWLERCPDPCPAHASKRQATAPIATLYQIRLMVTYLSFAQTNGNLLRGK
jgi:hypothetical protein